MVGKRGSWCARVALTRALPPRPYLEAVLVDAKAHDLRLESLVRNSEHCGRTTSPGNPTLAFRQCGLDRLAFTIGEMSLILGKDTPASAAWPGHLARFALQPCLVDYERRSIAQDHRALNDIL